MILTAEYPTFCHPDKVCDQISDAIVDACLVQDPNSRVAVNTMGGHGYITVTGEITTNAKVDYEEIIRDTYRFITHKSISGVNCYLHSQSPDIAQGVDIGGAGDQGVMIGYATSETKTRMPLEMEIARQLAWQFDTDGKSQVTVDGKKVTDIVLSIQGKNQDELFKFIEQKFPEYVDVNLWLNNTGKFEVGGFDADTGLTGRKIVCDAYGPRVSVGGGAFSGKDPTKVDRSGAYMARWVALKRLEETGANEVITKIAYVIGKAEPLEASAIIDGVEENLLKDKRFDFRPKAIIEQFSLKAPIYFETARLGHFGRMVMPWEVIK